MASITAVSPMTKTNNSWRRFATNISAKFSAIPARTSAWIARVFIREKSERLRKKSEQESSEIISEFPRLNASGFLSWISESDGE
jgi:hypothetical protein